MAVTIAALIATLLLAACGGGDDRQMRATLTDDGCAFQGDRNVTAGRFTVEVEDETGHGAHFVLKELADGLTADMIDALLDHPGVETPSLFKDEPVFASDVSGGASGVLLADVSAGDYVLMCRGPDPGPQGPYVAAKIEVTGTPSSP